MLDQMTCEEGGCDSSMKEHDPKRESIIGGVSAAESRGIANKKGGIMARGKKVGKHRRKRGHKK